MDSKNDTLKSIGEKAFIGETLKGLKVSSNFINGFGHDASLFRLSSDLMLAMKIDRAAKPFVLSNNLGNYESWGYLAVTANISDILSVGAIPKTFMISLTLPSDFHIEDTSQIIDGVVKACNDFNVEFIGGDTKEGKEINIVGAANGLIYGKSFLSRSKAQAGDLVAIVGEIGTFAGNYLKFQNGEKLTDDEIKYMAYPQPKIKEASILNNYTNLINAAMDNSDGLGDILLKISEYSKVQLEINIEDIPYSKSAKIASKAYNIPIENLAFFIGDWNIVYTIPEKSFGFLKKLVEQQGGLLTSIGIVKEDALEKNNIYIKEKTKYKLTKQLYNEAFLSTFENGESFSDKILTKNSILTL